MADEYKIYLERNVQDIANAIRQKNKKTTKYKISEMAQAIKDIEIPEYPDYNSKKY